MTIKKRDGSTYRLAGPNPIIKTQSLWENDSSPVKMHNFIWEEVVNRPSKQRIVPKLEIVVSEQEPVLPLATIEPEEIIVPIKVKGDTGYCLPATLVETIDPLYGDRIKSITYGEQVSLTLRLVNETDLGATIWASHRGLHPGSILFLPKQKRWWKVRSSTEESGGSLLECYISDLSPSFAL